VGGLDYLLRSRPGDAQEIFQQELEKCRPLMVRLARGRQCFPVKVTQDFSYRADRIAGEGWVLVGDAFGFLDPIYSSGVFLALKSGEWAADAINQALAKDDVSAAQLGGFGPEFVRGMEAVRKLVYAFYTRNFSFAQFLQRFPECKQGIVDILSGRVFSARAAGVFLGRWERCADCRRIVRCKSSRRVLGEKPYTPCPGVKDGGILFFCSGFPCR
jgi:hypothetical protein